MEQELYHYGILGMKWGIRRYQNPDGSLTSAGRKRYSGAEGQRKLSKDISQINARISKSEFKGNTSEVEFLKKMRDSLVDETKKYYDSFSADEKKFQELMKKDISQLSTQDLQFMNNRIQAKNAYASNTESYASKFMRTVATQVASQLAAEYLRVGAKKVLGYSGKKVSSFATKQKFEWQARRNERQDRENAKQKRS